MNTLQRLVPSPLLSLVILAMWLALATEVSVGQTALGAVLALAVPKLTERFWSDGVSLRRPLLGLRLLAVVMYDIVTANLAVARRVVGPIDQLRPLFVEVPLDLRDTYVATILGSIVSLTPGTVSIELDSEKWTLLIHALDIASAEELIDAVKQRYEQPLREIFAC